MKYAHLAIISIALLIGCKSSSSYDNVKVVHDTVYQRIYERRMLSGTNKDSLVFRVMSYNDTLAYTALLSLFLEYRNENEFLPYALHMANSKNFPEACFEVYFILTNCSGFAAVDELPVKEKYLALSFLTKGVEAGNLNCKGEINAYIGRRAIKVLDHNEYMQLYLKEK